MLTEMDAGRIATIIVKDMSRLGRDYLKVGYYTEIAFADTLDIQSTSKQGRSPTS